MITADTITDEQIRELCVDSSEHDVIVNIALRGPDGWMTADDVRVARARCAELLNERAVDRFIAEADSAWGRFAMVNPNFVRDMAAALKAVHDERNQLRLGIEQALEEFDDIGDLRTCLNYLIGRTEGGAK